MSNVKEINLSFDLGQILNDVLVKCNLISSGIKDEAQADIRASIMAPDSPETRSIINRALTEAFGNAKVACQRYLRTGRTVDNNMLEQMVKSVTYKEAERQKVDDNGHLLFDCTETTGEPAVTTPHVVYKDVNGELVTWKDSTTNNTVTPDDTPTPKMETYTTDEIDTITYETIELNLFIPNFNVSVTDALKSSIHKYVVDYIMGRFLQDQQADKAGEYAALADGKDYQQIVSNLNSPERFNVRKPSWI